MADEVKTPKGLLMANAQCGVPAAASKAMFLKYYKGKSADFEEVLVHDWAQDRWAGPCERGSYKPGQVSKFWPEVTRPCGRIHFAGAYSSPMSWGQEAAVESANRVAREIDQA
jgi:monoamine oxidase